MQWRSGPCCSCLSASPSNNARGLPPWFLPTAGRHTTSVVALENNRNGTTVFLTCRDRNIITLGGQGWWHFVRIASDLLCRSSEIEKEDSGFQDRRKKFEQIAYLEINEFSEDIEFSRITHILFLGISHYIMLSLHGDVTVRHKKGCVPAFRINIFTDTL